MHLREVAWERKTEKYQPRELTAEEFDTLTSLLARIKPNRPTAALFDHFLKGAGREPLFSPNLPPDVWLIRAGLQLLNDDALRMCDQPFGSLSAYQQEALLVALKSEGDTHWPQLPAGQWYEEVLHITAGLFQAEQEIYGDGQVQRSA